MLCGIKQNYPTNKLWGSFNLYYSIVINSSSNAFRFFSALASLFLFYFLSPFCALFFVRLRRTELNTLVKMVINITMPAARIHQSGSGNTNRHTKKVPKLMAKRIQLMSCNFFMALFLFIYQTK